jgi:hypothetical protein
VKTEYSTSFRVSQRVVLTPGVRFRAKGGPLVRLSDGTRVALAAKGPFVFMRHCQRGTCQWIDALDKAGNYAPLHIGGRRRKVTPAMVLRPYRITGTVRKEAKPRAKPR